MNSLTALVIDDDSFVQRVLGRQLVALGAANVINAAEGNAALAILRTSQSIDLIICDLMMPGLDGIQFLRELQQIRPGIALILVSGVQRKVLNTAEQAARARGLKVLGALSKPVSSEALRELISKLSQQSAAPANQAEKVELDELQQAIKNDEIVPFVQPQINARNRRLYGVEALARWQSPTRGTVGPAAFIELAECSGLISELSRVMFRKSVEACGHLCQQGLDLRISVNATVDLLEDVSLPDRLNELVRYAGILPQQLTVEITESGALNSSAQVLDVLARLRIHDFELSIDDFGTGYAMLGQLKEIPFTEMKIDQSFVMAAARDSEALHIVESSLRLARDLGLRTVAEGVETDTIAALMTRLGCDLLQGYSIAKPMPIEQLIAWNKSRAAL